MMEDHGLTSADIPKAPYKKYYNQGLDPQSVSAEVNKYIVID